MVQAYVGNEHSAPSASKYSEFLHTTHSLMQGMNSNSASARLLHASTYTDIQLQLQHSAITEPPLHSSCLQVPSTWTQCRPLHTAHQARYLDCGIQETRRSHHRGDPSVLCLFLILLAAGHRPKPFKLVLLLKFGLLGLIQSLSSLLPGFTIHEPRCRGVKERRSKQDPDTGGNRARQQRCPWHRSSRALSTWVASWRQTLHAKRRPRHLGSLNKCPGRQRRLHHGSRSHDVAAVRQHSGLVGVDAGGNGWGGCTRGSRNCQ